jgi:hypothetical protein
MAALRRPLPITFRINGSGKFAHDLRARLEKDFLSSFSDGPIKVRIDPAYAWGALACASARASRFPDNGSRAEVFPACPACTPCRGAGGFEPECLPPMAILGPQAARQCTGRRGAKLPGLLCPLLRQADRQTDACWWHAALLGTGSRRPAAPLHKHAVESHADSTLSA